MTRDPVRCVGTNTGRVAVALAAVLFGTAATAAGRWSPNLGGTSLAGWRLVIGGTTLVMLSVVAGRAPWRYPLPIRPVALGALTVAGFQICYFAAVDRLGVTQATMLTIATGPVVAAAFDHVRGRAAISVRWCAGSLMAVAGIAVLSTGTWVMDPLGWGLAILAGFGFPIYGSVIGSLARDRPRLTAVATVFGAAVPFAGIIALRSGGPALPAGDDVITVTYLGLIATALAYYLWTIGLETLPVRDTVLITMLEPITATLLAAAILNEDLPPITALAIATIITGIAVAATGSTAELPGARREVVDTQTRRTADSAALDPGQRRRFASYMRSSALASIMSTPGESASST